MRGRGRPRKVLALSAADTAVLEKRVRAGTTPQRDLRARIVLMCANGDRAESIAKTLGIHVHTVVKWRSRFSKRGIDGLNDLPRPGPKPKFTAVDRLEIIKLACEPVTRKDGVSKRTIEELRQEAMSSGSIKSIGWGTVQGILAKADLRPHLTEGWLHSPDPLFREKVSEICELYLKPPGGEPVLSIDEKPGMQALERKHPDKMPAPGRKRRREFEYKRHGTKTLLGCFDVHTGRVVSEVGDTRKAKDLVAFMEQVAKAYPVGTVHIVWDNLNIHHEGPDKRWTAFNQRHGNRFKFHYTPIHASWVNQIELFFSVFQRKCLRGASFTSSAELQEGVVAFIKHWNAEKAKPFKWTFSGYPLQIGENAA